MYLSSVQISHMTMGHEKLRIVAKMYFHIGEEKQETEM